MNDSQILSPLERDMLGELLNVGIGSAAVALSKIIKQEVKLSVPDVTFITSEEMAQKLGVVKQVSCVSQHVSGAFEGNSMLLFPEESSIEVVRKMLGEDIPMDTIKEVHQEAFIEIGNIMINSCMDAISEVLNVDFEVSPANYQLSTPHKLLPKHIGSDEMIVMDAGINFTLSDSHEDGSLVFLMGPFSLEGLKASLAAIIRKL